MKLRFTSALRSISIVAVALFSLVPAYGQTSSATPPTNEARQAHAWRLLFRQSVTYNRLADEADAAGKPDPHFRRILATRLHLSDFDAASLLRISLAYQAEEDPVRKQIAAEIMAYRARLPFDRKALGKDVVRPPDLGPLHAQEDEIALRYRDLLRNAMRPEDFQKMVSRIQITFGVTLQ